MKTTVTILFFLLIGIAGLKSQDNLIVVRANILDGDTIPQISLKEVEVFSLLVPKSKKRRRKLTRYVKNVKKVYPYARLAGIQLRKYEHLLLQAENDKDYEYYDQD